MPLVTIGIPTYMRSAGLRRVLNEVCTQTYRDLEIIVSDNASTDDTAEVVREYAERDPRITYYRQPENVGPTSNFQFVLSKATGKYFAWITDDDRTDSRFIESLVAPMQAHPEIALAMSDVKFRDTTHASEERTIELSTIRLEHCLADWSRVRRIFFRYPIWDVFLAIYGLYRTDVARALPIDLRSRWKGLYFNGEAPHLAKVACRGMIVSVPGAYKTYLLHESSYYTRELNATTSVDRVIRHTEIRCQMSATALQAELDLLERFRLSTYPWLSVGHKFRRSVRRRLARATSLR